LHGNKIRANAENWERYMRNLQLEMEMQKLLPAIGPGGESGTERAIREGKEKEKQGTTPSGYNPNTGQPPNQPQGQQNATPSGYGAARF
jgi:hypothetical protein